MPDSYGLLLKESGNSFPARISINSPGRGDGDDSAGDLKRSDVIMTHGR
jgi:hypothetical protein